jgi:hypothetical protein
LNFLSIVLTTEAQMKISQPSSARLGACNVTRRHSQVHQIPADNLQFDYLIMATGMRTRGKWQDIGWYVVSEEALQRKRVMDCNSLEASP